jgi:aminopeptidase N
MLEEIQRTGDIFFPGRWLDATLGGHNQVEAAETVRRFLAERPDLPPRLRAKVLQSADGVWRAAAIAHGWTVERGG